ncbi:MAG: DUF881 domain-containing protein, partial [Candidatus Phosphoribacter sp.]
VSASTLKSATSVVGQARDQLTEQISDGRRAGDEQAARVAALVGEVAAARESALGLSGQGSIIAELASLELIGGGVAVTGPGISITLDDSAEAQAGDPDRGAAGFEDGRVSAADLQIVTNGLWSAGAEAVSINGQRLTARSAIRFAGQAVLVDFRPLTRPYVITAIGDPVAMPTTLGASVTGSYLKALEDNYGIRVEINTGSDLTCPAGALSALQHARARPDDVRSAEPSRTITPATPSSSTPSTRTASRPTASTPRRTASTTTEAAR